MPPNFAPWKMGPVFPRCWLPTAGIKDGGFTVNTHPQWGPFPGGVPQGTGCCLTTQTCTPPGRKQEDPTPADPRVFPPAGVRWGPQAVCPTALILAQTVGGHNNP